LHLPRSDSARSSPSACSNPAVTALLDRAEVEPDREARVQEYRRAAAPGLGNDALWIEKFPFV